MAEEHTSLLWLPHALRQAGLNVVELPGWRTNKQNYFWTTPGDPDYHEGYEGDPLGAEWHHTVSSRYVPYVRNSHGQTKANLWYGLLKDGVLYHVKDGGIPTVVVASAGPANYSSGSGRKDLFTEFLMRDQRYFGPQTVPDGSPKFYGNRYVINSEVVHPGYGESLHPGVWEAIVVTGAVASDHYGWSAWRNHGHYDFTTRKVDPRFARGYPYSIREIQDDIKDLLDNFGGGVPPSGGDMSIRKIEDPTWVTLGKAGGFDGTYYTRAGDANGASVYNEDDPDAAMWHAYNVGLAAIGEYSMQSSGVNLGELDQRYARKTHPHTAKTTVN